jgi:osmotically-inducible protein OsmY
MLRQVTHQPIVAIGVEMKRSKRDNDLQERVIDELRADANVNAAHIGVSAEEGAVTLTGEVASNEERLAAHEAAKRVSGVIALADEIDVNDMNPVTGGMKNDMTDTDVALAVVRALERIGLADGDVQVEVLDSVVVLSGEVKRDADRTRAETAALEADGVLNVVNQIAIGPPAPYESVQQAILDAFHRQADRAVDGIVIDVVDGHVELRGKTSSLHDRELAERSALATAGVRSVKNHLRIRV